MHFAIKFLAFLPAAMSAGYVSGCGSTKSGVPIELAQARQAFMRADASPAPIVTPAHMRSARRTLDAAERAFRDAPEAPATRDLAYIAIRTSELAEAASGAILAQRRKAEAARELGVELAPSTREPEVVEGSR